MTNSITKPQGVVVFDLDGTLSDTSGDIVFSSNAMRRRAGLAPLSHDEVMASVGHGSPYLLQQILQLDPDDPSLSTLVPEFQQHYLQHQGQRSALYPGIKQAVATLSTRYHLYILSNKLHAPVLREAEDQGIAPYFQHIWGAGDFAALKPDPTGILTALKLSNILANCAVMIGDSVVDIQAGQRAGVKTCFADWGFAPLPPNAPQPSVRLSDPQRLVVTIDRMLAP